MIQELEGTQTRGYDLGGDLAEVQVSCQCNHSRVQLLSCLTSQRSCFQVCWSYENLGLNLIWHLSWLFVDDCKFPKLSSHALHSIFQFSSFDVVGPKVDQRLPRMPNIDVAMSMTTLEHSRDPDLE